MGGEGRLIPQRQQSPGWCSGTGRPIAPVTLPCTAKCVLKILSAQLCAAPRLMLQEKWQSTLDPASCSYSKEVLSSISVRLLKSLSSWHIVLLRVEHLAAECHMHTGTRTDTYLRCPTSNALQGYIIGPIRRPKLLCPRRDGAFQGCAGVRPTQGHPDCSRRRQLTQHVGARTVGHLLHTGMQDVHQSLQCMPDVLPYYEALLSAP